MKVKPGKLSLTPTTSMFTAPDTVYPVYIDRLTADGRTDLLV